MTSDGSTGAEVRARATAWMLADPDPETRAELAELLERGDDEALARLFDGYLEFGTAGLRAPMGAGPRRMNRVVVRRATAGLLSVLPDGARVVIGRDARKNSDVFAEDAARVVAAAGGHALVWAAPVPTPLVAFAVRHLGADAGVVCTASHNPPSDNGFKVYAADGAQLVPPDDARVARAIEQIDAVALAADGDAGMERLDQRVEDAYLAHVAELLPTGGARADDVRVVYSALHGVGAGLTLAAFERVGLPAPHVVEAQLRPDGSFPTVTSPNPEEPDATALAVDDAARVGADVALVHDPDADRLGVLAPIDGKWRALTGNEIGLLLADHILTHSSGPERLVVDTVVSSSALGKLAASHGVHHARMLTGFKWIVRPAMEHPEWRFVFGYEEALGFSVDPFVRDKDAISAALVLVDLVASLRARGESVSERLRGLATEHGLFTTASWTLPVAEREQLAQLMARLRSSSPKRVGDVRVRTAVDYLPGSDLPPTDLLEYHLGDGSRLSVRPSGTEPKLKVYAEVVSTVGGEGDYAGAVSTAHRRLADLRAAFMPMLESLLTT